MKWTKRFWLKIWSKLRELFGRKKMEIDKTINKWFEEAQSKLAKANASPVLNGICRSAIAVLKRYCHATTVLLDKNNGFKLPAMAQLRIMSELAIKILWCLEGKTSQEIEKRIKRWEKTSLSEDKRLIDNLASTNNEEIRNFYEERSEHLNDLCNSLKGIRKEMPPTSQLFKKLLGDEMYAKMFVQFNRAVHIDAFVLTESVKTQGGSFEFTGDIDTNTDNLKGCCLGFVYMFLKRIYDFYKWGFGEIEKECQVICKQSDNIKN